MILFANLTHCISIVSVKNLLVILMTFIAPRQEKAEKQTFNLKTLFSGFLKDVT